MIEVTDEMLDAVDEVWVGGGSASQAVAAIIALVERDHRVEAREPDSVATYGPDKPRLCICPASLCYSDEARALDLRCRAVES